MSDLIDLRDRRTLFRIAGAGAAGLVVGSRAIAGRYAPPCPIDLGHTIS